MWSMTPAVIQQLETWRLKARFSHRNGPAQVTGDDGKEIDYHGDTCVCELQCVLTGKRVCEAAAPVVSSPDEAERRALDVALSRVDRDNIPRTPGEIAAENRQLRQRLDELEGKQASKKPAGSKPEPAGAKG